MNHRWFLDLCYVDYLFYMYYSNIKVHISNTLKCTSTISMLMVGRTDFVGITVCRKLPYFNLLPPGRQPQYVVVIVKLGGRKYAVIVLDLVFSNLFFAMPNHD